MKTHAIIPIFIPHEGCPNDCVFCNQRRITAHVERMTEEEVISTVEEWLSTLEPMKVPQIEIAFYGGSFTGLSEELQNTYLKIGKMYKDSGRISKIHLSTRPDYISPHILDNLRRYGVDVIELGVQSFDEDVLEASKRGHCSKDVYEACTLIKHYGFTLGIQLMIGLPKDTFEKDMFSVEETIKIGPEIARIYPTVVIDDTELYDMYLSGLYVPPPLEDMVFRAKEMYKRLTAENINIIRVGLKSSDLIKEGASAIGNTFHPAFRQLVEGEILKEKAEIELLSALKSHYELAEVSNSEPASPNHDFSKKLKVDFITNPRSFSNLIGHGKSNKLYFENKYPKLNIAFRTSQVLEEDEVKVLLKP